MNSIKKYIQIISRQIRVFVFQIHLECPISKAVLTSLNRTSSEREENLRGFSPQANYTDRATATWRS
jgi:hypothetical protein